METKIIDLYKQKGKEQYFLTVLQEYMDKEAIQKQLSPATKRKYLQYYRRIKEFLELTDQSTVNIREVRVVTMEKLRTHLMTVIGSGISHSSRHIELCKRALSYSVEMEYTLNNPLEPLKAKRDKIKDVVYLDTLEVSALAEISLKGKLLNRVRDMYLFQCWTGLSFGDLWSYSISEKDGFPWIVNNRSKNGNPYFVPVFPEAHQIHEKYCGKFPSISNQQYNRILKEVASFAGIEKYLTTHTGRKTFATIMDQKGVSTKTIADLLGNTLQVCQKHYLGKSSKRIENELEALNLIPKKIIVEKDVMCQPCKFAI